MLLAFLGCAVLHPASRLKVSILLSDVSQQHQAIPETVEYGISAEAGLFLLAESLDKRWPVRNFDSDTVYTDWRYFETIDIVDGGERWTLKQHQYQGRVSGDGLKQMELQKVVRSTQQIAGQNPQIDEKQEPIDLSKSLSAQAVELELKQLTSFGFSGGFRSLYSAVKQSIPPNYVLLNSQKKGQIVLERSHEKSIQSVTKKKSARWDLRDRIILEKTGNLVEIQITREHRMTKDGQVGPWRNSKSHDFASALMFWRRLIQAADGRIKLNPAGVELSKYNRGSLSLPPRPPNLRTMNQIKEVITAKAIEEAKGDFSVCLAGLFVNPKNPYGLTWDLGYVDLTVGTIGVTGELVSEVGKLTGDTVDLGIDVTNEAVGIVTQGRVKKAGTYAALHPAVKEVQAKAKMADELGSLTSDIAKITKEFLPSSPDVKGQVSIHGKSLNIPVVRNQLVREFDSFCIDGRFNGTSPAIDLWLEDLDRGQKNNDIIGQCHVQLRTVIGNQGSGIQCDQARVYYSYEFNFSPEMISYIGLPPPERQK